MFGWKKRDKKPATTTAAEASGEGMVWSFDALTAEERSERAAHWPHEEEMALEAARSFVDAGFRTQQDARVTMREVYDELAPDAATLDALVDRVWSERLAEQETWQGPSDYSKVASAFDTLAEKRIVARMDFACCQRCGHGEIAGEVDDPKVWRGYAFFHQQDAEGLGQEPTALYLAFGGFDGKDATELAVAEDVAEAARAAGLQVEWNGSTQERIRLVDLRWRKPLPTA